jgi:hypothetical protein
MAMNEYEITGVDSKGYYKTEATDIPYKKAKAIKEPGHFLKMYLNKGRVFVEVTPPSEPNDLYFFLENLQ